VATIEYVQVRKGMTILGDNGELLEVVDRDLNTPGNWRAILTLKLRNFRTGSIAEKRVRPQDKVDLVYLDKRPMQYLYAEGDGFVFMDKETFDQYTLDREAVADQMKYLKENDDAQVTLYNGTPVGLELPPQVELKVTETAAYLKGATAAAQYKSATLETGLQVQVPPFIEVGEVVQIKTETGEYLGRAK
jgi:elongation factor P